MGRKGLSPNGNIIDADAAFHAGLVDESGRDEMIRKYNKLPKSRSDIALELYSNMKDILENRCNGFMDETQFVNSVNIEVMNYVSNAFNKH